jgi:hypothetical protein
MEYRFTLTYNSVDTEVIEPKGWVDFKSEIKRDFKSHGVMFKFTSGTLKLGFAGGGRTILEDAFQLEGFNACVILTVDSRRDEFNSWVNVFVGNAVMENRELDENYFNVDFEESTFQQKVINRLNTKVRLDSTTDLDGNTLNSSLTEYTADWNDIRLINEYIANYRVGGNSSLFVNTNAGDASGGGNDATLYPEFNFQGIIDDELEEFQTITEQTLGTIPTASNFIMSKAGTVTVSGTVKYRLQTTVTLTTAASNAELEYDYRVRRLNNVGTLISDVSVGTGASTTDSASPYVNDTGVTSLSFSVDVTVNAADQLIFYFAVKGRPKTPDAGEITDLQIDSLDFYHSSRIEYSLLNAASTNSVKSSLIHDVINRILYIISGENNSLNSSFLGLTQHGYSVDGCGGLTVLTNGEKLRGITSSINVSLKEILDSVQAIWGMGYSFEKDYTGEYSFRLELLEYFYTDSEIIDLGSPVSIKERTSYKEEVFSDLVFSNIKIGYSKFSSDENLKGNLEDFSTASEYSLPIPTISGTYTQTSKLITSGRLIQATYDETDVTKVWKYDSNIFLVAVVRSASVFIPENNQNFSTTAGIDDPTTAYNIRHAPVYMFLNHASIVNSVMMGVPLDKEIINVNTEVNRSFSALFDPAETCLLGDSQRLTRTSIGNITIEDNNEGHRLFDPITHSLTVAMTKTQLDLIIDNMENNGDNNYGYLSYKDNEGNAQEGYLLNIKWNPNDEIADIETLERADNYGV